MSYSEDDKSESGGNANVRKLKQLVAMYTALK